MRDHPDWIVRKPIDMTSSLNGDYREDIVGVSHRLELAYHAYPNPNPNPTPTPTRVPSVPTPTRPLPLPLTPQAAPAFSSSWRVTRRSSRLLTPNLTLTLTLTLALTLNPSPAFSRPNPSPTPTLPLTPQY